jgi:hypothetical protein
LEAANAGFNRIWKYQSSWQKLESLGLQVEFQLEHNHQQKS